MNCVRSSPHDPNSLPKDSLPLSSNTRLDGPAGFGDEPLVDAIVKDASSHDLAMRSFIHSLVQSKAFRTK
jgi:hypothetical protein